VDTSKHIAHQKQIDAASDAPRLAFAVALMLIITAIISLIPVLPLITIS